MKTSGRVKLLAKPNPKQKPDQFGVAVQPNKRLSNKKFPTKRKVKTESKNRTLSPKP
jgi:hypothetical protein